jgi:hypothetical protein
LYGEYPNEHAIEIEKRFVAKEIFGKEKKGSERVITA